MTENEAKEILNRIATRNVFCTLEEEPLKAFEMTENALEEIQQYRAIGTVKQFEWCKDASHWKELFKEKLAKYEAIGTVEELKTLKDIDEDLRLKYCYEDLSNAENRGYCQGSNEAVDAFAKFLHEKAKENNGLRLSSETRSWTHSSIYDYLEEFKNEQICKEEVNCESEE